MKIKEVLMSYLNYLNNNSKCEHNVDDTSVMLDDKVNQFINWYTENQLEVYTNAGKYNMPRNLRNLIEKIAVWYELRYPDYEINRLMSGSKCENIKINDVMFKNNYYFRGLLDENSDIKYLDWDDFYNTHTFISSLSCDEKYFFAKPAYPNLIYLDGSHRPHLHLTKKGIVTEAEYVDVLTHNVIKNKELEGLHLKQVAELLNSRGIKLSENFELFRIIQNVDKKRYQKEEMLNCVMYRIIERGGNRIGPRRAFLFAKEFNRNIDIPMIYGVDLSDSGLESFVNIYLEAGGSKQLECLVGYFSRTSDVAKFDTITIEELMKKRNFKTTSELKEQQLNQKKQKELLQKLAILLSKQISQSELEEIKQEKVKQLRLARKLEKSKKTSN